MSVARQEESKSLVSRGQPTKYKPEYINLLQEYFLQGKTVTQFAKDIRVDRDSIYNWAKEHPDFFGALSRGKQFREGFWQDWIMQNLDNPKVNANLFKLFAANTMGWSDKTENLHHVEVTQMSDSLRDIQESYGKDY